MDLAVTNRDLAALLLFAPMLHRMIDVTLQ